MMGMGNGGALPNMMNPMMGGMPPNMMGGGGGVNPNFMGNSMNPMNTNPPNFMGQPQQQPTQSQNSQGGGGFGMIPAAP